MSARRPRLILSVTHSTGRILHTRSSGSLSDDGDNRLRVAGRDAALFAKGASKVVGRRLPKGLVNVWRAIDGEQRALRGFVVYPVEAFDAEAARLFVASLREYLGGGSRGCGVATLSC